MTRKHTWTGVAVGMLGLALAQGVNALDITIADPHRDKLFNGTKTGPSLPENDRVEWNAIANQTWDLEQFDLSGSKLSMTGGFNYLTGVGSGASIVAPMGDIFVYIGQIPYSIPDGPEDHNGPWVGAANWDYVIAFERGSGALDAANIKESGGQVKYDIFSSGTYATTGGSGTLNTGLPWRYTATVTYSMTANYSTYSDGEGTHYSLSNIDLSSILTAAAGEPVYLHATMRCGNDVLWGSVPDGGLTVTLLGLGLAGLGFVARRRN